MVVTAHKTGKLQRYRIQFTYNFIKFLRNSSPTTLPPPPPYTTTTTDDVVDDDDDNNNNNNNKNNNNNSQSVSHSEPSYFESPGSIAGQSKRDLWWVKGHWNIFSPGS